MLLVKKKIIVRQLKSQDSLANFASICHSIVLKTKKNHEKQSWTFYIRFLELIAGLCVIWNADSENKSSFLKYFNAWWVAKSVFHKQLFPDRTDNFSTLVFLRWHLRIYLVFREKEKNNSQGVPPVHSCYCQVTLC